MSSSNSQRNYDACIKYLSHMLDVRVGELKAANHNLALLARRSCCFSVEMGSDSKENDLGLNSGTFYHQESEIVEDEELSFMRHKLEEAENKLQDSLGVISCLEAKVRKEEFLRLEKEDTIEKLEDSIMLNQGELAEMTEMKSACIELQSKLNASEKFNNCLRSELADLKAALQLKEQATAQAVFEKDEMEETISAYKQLNSVLSGEISRLETLLNQENENREQVANEKRVWEREKAQFMEQIEVLGGELALCQQASSNMCSQSQLSNSQQLSQVTATKYELMTLQAEKEDLEQQLQMCRGRSANVRIQCQCVEQGGRTVSNTDASRIITDLEEVVHNLNAENSQIRKSLNDTSVELDRLQAELKRCRLQLRGQESQNTELIAQLLVLEDRLAESEAAHRESQNTVERLTAMTADTAGSLAQMQDKVCDVTSRLKSSESELHCCKAQLELLDSKYKTVSEHYRQLLSQKIGLEKANLQLRTDINQLQTRHASTEKCVECIELEKLRSDFERMKRDYNELRISSSKQIEACCRQSPVRSSAVSRSKYSAGILRENFSQGSCSSGKNVSRMDSAIYQSLIQPPECGSEPVTVSKSVNRNQDSMPIDFCRIVHGPSSERRNAEEASDDFETPGSTKTCKRLRTQANVQLNCEARIGRRQLFDVSSTVFAGDDRSVGSISGQEKLRCQELTVVESPTAQTRERVGGRVSLSLNRRSPKCANAK